MNEQAKQKVIEARAKASQCLSAIRMNWNDDVEYSEKRRNMTNPEATHNLCGGRLMDTERNEWIGRDRDKKGARDEKQRKNIGCYKKCCVCESVLYGCERNGIFVRKFSLTRPSSPLPAQKAGLVRLSAMGMQMKTHTYTLYVYLIQGNLNYKRSNFNLFMKRV